AGVFPIGAFGGDVDQFAGTAAEIGRLQQQRVRLDGDRHRGRSSENDASAPGQSYRDESRQVGKSASRRVGEPASERSSSRGERCSIAWRGVEGPRHPLYSPTCRLADLPTSVAKRAYGTGRFSA